LLVLVLFISCSLFTSRYQPIEILVKGDTLTLAWDAPEYAGSYAGSVVETYIVYYRTRGAAEWKELREVEAEVSPSLTITNEDLDYGYYEFAVSAVDNDENESPLHSSTDTTADPITGWYVNWIGSR
jgi:hypothetical protein